MRPGAYRQRRGGRWKRGAARSFSVGKDLTVVKIGEWLARQGVVIPHWTLHRFCAEPTDYGGWGSGAGASR